MHVAMAEKILFTWSGGKDSAIALYELRKTKKYRISALLTTITSDYDRISMHGVRRILLERQAESLGYHLEKVYISKNSSDEEYASKMKEALEKYKSMGISSVAFGDIFLEDVRKYREERLSTIGMKAMFPLWKKNTTKLARKFIKLGFKAVVVCVDTSVLSKTFVGRTFDEQFLSELPSAVDPCGENGEFHTFVYDGPNFRKRISHTIGDVVLREKRFYYCDLIPA